VLGFLIGVVVGFIIALVGLRSRYDENNDKGINGEFDVLHRTLKDLLLQLYVVHNNASNPHSAPYTVRQDVNRCLSTLSSVMVQLGNLSRLSNSREVQAKWDELQKGVEQLDAYLQTELSETLNAVPALKAYENDESPRWLN
jgi:hypothetical protein